MTVPYTFGTESSPIPLSQLDANFAAPIAYANTAGNVTNAAQPTITSVGVLTSLSVAGNVLAGNLNTAGSTSTTGNVVAGNITTTGVISAYGTVTAGKFSTGGNIATAGQISATGTITTQGSVLAQGIVSATGNIVTIGQVGATGNITTLGNVLAQGVVSAAGNVVTASYFIGNFRGNVTGNVSVAGSNTQVLFNQNGNIGASAGLTYTTSPNALGILGTVSAQGNITTSANLSVGVNQSIGGNLVVTGTSQLVGVVTAPTAAVGTANNQVATTAFVNNFAGNLGTMSQQNASNVAITGGNITASNISTGTFTFVESGGKLLIKCGGVTVLSIDSGGNIITPQNVTAYGTP